MTSEAQAVPERESPSPRQLGWIFLLYLALAVVYTWPLASHLTTHIPGDTAVVDLQGDAALQSWYPWWIQKALLSDESVLYTDWVFYPMGTELTMQPAMFLHGAMTVPLWFLEITTANNVVILLSFALSGLAACLLGHYVLRSLPAALLCGFIYAFTPFKFLHLAGHYHLMATETLPLVALSLIRLLDRPTRSQMLWAGFWLGITIYTDYYYFAYALLLVATIVGYRLVLERDWRVLKYAAIAGVLALVPALPLLVPALLSASRSDYGIASGHDVHKADLLSPFVPGQKQWIGSLLSPLFGWTDGEWVDGIEHSVYVGWGLLVLCAIYGRHLVRNRETRLFLFVFVLFLVLAMGPTLGVNGRQHFGDTAWRIFLPGHLLAEAPVFEGARAPSRIFIIAALGLAVCAGAAFRRLLSAPRVLGTSSRAVAAAVALLTGIEYLVPLELSALDTPRWVEMIRDDPEPGLVAHVPMRPSRAAFWQPRMKRKMLDVRLGRIDYSRGIYYGRHTALKLLSVPSHISVYPLGSEAAYLVDLLRLRYIVIESGSMAPVALERTTRLLTEAYRMRQVFSDSSTTVFRFDGEFSTYRDMDFTVTHRASELQLLYGWSNRTIHEDQKVSWITAPRAVLLIPPMSDYAYTLELRLRLLSTDGSGTDVELMLDGRSLGTRTLSPGDNHLALTFDRGELKGDELNRLQIRPQQSAGFPHELGIEQHPAPHGIPIKVSSEGFFTEGRGLALVRVREEVFESGRPGLLLVGVGAAGSLHSEYFPFDTKTATVDSVRTRIEAAPDDAIIALATASSSHLYGPYLNSALELLGLHTPVPINRLDSFAFIGSKDGRAPLMDTGAAVAELVVGKQSQTKQVAIGLVGMSLRSR